ncbi:CT620/CT621 family type III secretion system effector [Chlamydia sp. 17-3921]|uniref:CT620/CT621 family type III secretion system effector n=1 Tax=Chlamydia sp. 17-3921 TaxID=2675798 RepID=UPI001918AB4B|nr:CT620/CT621 family type III secretion system effector [Chlamydia sp. 17-3921]
MINSTSISTLYRKLPINLPTLVPVQQPRQLLEQIFQYEKTTIERFVVYRLLQLLEQKSEEQYRRLQEKLHKYETELRTVTKFTRAIPQREKPLSSSHSAISATATTSTAGTSTDSASEVTYYNGAKQNWAKNLVANINLVMIQIMAQVNSASPNNKETFNTINTEVQRLVGLGVHFTEEDFQSLYNLPEKIFTAIQRADTFPGGVKAQFTNDLSEKYGNEDSLVQTFADIRIEGLRDILAEIKTRLTTEQFKIFLDIERNLLTLSDHMASFSDTDLQLIKATGESLAALINESELSRNNKTFFCEDITDLYKDQVNALTSFDSVVAASVYVNQHQGSVFSLITDLMASLMGAFAPIDLSTASVDVSSASISGVLQTVRAINARFNELTPQQQALVNDAVNSLKSFKTEEYLGAVWAYFIASTVIAMNASASMAEVGEAIKASAAELDGSAFGLAANMKKTMENIVTANGQFKVSGSTDTYTIYKQIPKGVELNQILLNYGNVGFLPNITKAAQNNAETSARAYFAYKALAAVESEKLLSKVEELQNEQRQFNSLKKDVYAQQLVAQASEVRAMPLPSAVASVLIDRYMPKEVEFLNSIYGELYYSNFGSTIGNAMIEAIAQYVNGATYFNFASYVGQQPAVGAGGKDTFPGSKDSAQAKLDREREQAALYLTATRKAIKVLQEQRAKTLADNKITNEQRSKILDSLQLYQDNLNTISGSLVLLQNYLAPLEIESGTIAGTFVVKNGQDQWQSRLETLEDALVSGLVGNAINGGMFVLQATVQADQQGFADLGQNFQLELQMHLTSMQQEWTVVATSLQVLNQMYLSLARSLVG